MRALLIVMIVAAAAHAGPVVDVTLAEKDVEAAFQPLVPQYDEPIGLAVIANNPKLGLLKGDLVRAINGEAALAMGMFGPHTDGSLVYLDVVRGGRSVVVRVAITRDAIEDHMERDRFKERLDMMKRFAGEAFKQVTKNGNPSGVLVNGFLEPLAEGDVIRAIDGATVTTADQAVAALDRASDHDTVTMQIERLGRPMVAKLTLEASADLDPALLAKIVKKNDTTFEVSKDVLDAVMANPMIVARGARMVPAVMNGKPTGFKLYAIRPGSLYTALGLANGDTVLKVNGKELDTADKALEVYTKLRDAKKITVDIVRRGTAMTITYVIKS